MFHLILKIERRRKFEQCGVVEIAVAEGTEREPDDVDEESSELLVPSAGDEKSMLFLGPSAF